MNDKVISFPSRKGGEDVQSRYYLSGPARCRVCSTNWQAVVDPEVDVHSLECPSCHALKGYLLEFAAPEVMLRCPCGCDLFFIAPDGLYCATCGKPVDDIPPS